MSAYAEDSIDFNGIHYNLVRGGPFSTAEHGIFPYNADTYTPTGSLMGFAVDDKQLYLRSLYTNHDPNAFEALISNDKPWNENLQDDNNVDPLSLSEKPIPKSSLPAPPPLNGVKPEPLSDNYWHYANIDLPLDYTGTLTLDRIPVFTGDESEHYIHQELKAFIDSGATCSGWTLEFKNGKLIAETGHEPDDFQQMHIDSYKRSLNAATDFDAWDEIIDGSLSEGEKLIEPEISAGAEPKDTIKSPDASDADIADDFSKSLDELLAESNNYKKRDE